MRLIQMRTRLVGALPFEQSALNPAAAHRRHQGVIEALDEHVAAQAGGNDRLAGPGNSPKHEVRTMLDTTRGIAAADA